MVKLPRFAQHHVRHHLVPSAHARRWPSRHPGQSLVEFAMTLPFIMFLLIGIVDLGRIYFSYMTIVNAAREGARYGAAHPTGDITSRVKLEGAGGAIDPALMTVTFTSCPCAQGSIMNVNVTYPFQLITGYIFGGGTVTIGSSTDMVIFGE